ncbi:MAG: hypothetical protein OZ921_07565 [Sorangiineae bacterium]|nr:hypothetical protein [Polyangiaceae bacterium]MEB2322355.1 hypothetical protein [Sorangiineae bacterium]
MFQPTAIFLSPRSERPFVVSRLHLRLALRTDRTILRAGDHDPARSATLPSDLEALLEADALGLSLPDELLEPLVRDLEPLLVHRRVAQVASASGLAATAPGPGLALPVVILAVRRGIPGGGTFAWLEPDERLDAVREQRAPVRRDSTRSMIDASVARSNPAPTMTRTPSLSTTTVRPLAGTLQGARYPERLLLCSARR